MLPCGRPTTASTPDGRASARSPTAASGILLGRTTYEMFEPAWSTRTVEDDPGAPFFNDTTKYVVSGTLTDPTWSNSTVIGAYDPDTIRHLKDEVAATSTSAAAAPSSGRCSPTASSTSSTSGCTRHLRAQAPEDAGPTTMTLAASETYPNQVLYLNPP